MMGDWRVTFAPPSVLLADVNVLLAQLHPTTAQNRTQPFGVAP